MRPTHYTKFIFILLMLPLTLFSQDKYNLNFDNYNPEQEMPTGWFKWGNFKSIEGAKESDGNYVGKITSDKEGKFGCITYRIPANYVGDTIKLTGRIKYKKVRNYVGLLLRIDGHVKNKSLAFKSMQKEKIRGSSDWKEYSIKMPYPANATNIYVGGILGQKGTAWFDDFKVTIDGKDIQTLKETKQLTLDDYNSEKLTSALAKSSFQFDISNEDTLDSLMTKLGDKKIVAIGESTHGTSEFYQIREIITKRLIKEKGFDLVVLENPYDDIEMLNRDVNNKSLDSLMRKHLFSIYQTQEMKSFLQWYKNNRLNYNIEFKGCDDSYWTFYELLTDLLAPINDTQLKELLNDVKANILENSTDNFKKETKINNQIYNDISAIETRLKAIGKLTSNLQEVLFNGKNTYINFVNIKNNEPFQSRDEIMAERISYLANNTDRKIIVWAHNAHISNQIVTGQEIGIMGRDLKKEFGKDYFSIGLTTLKGNYSYIDQKFINGDHNFSERLKTETIQPREGLFWENVLAQQANSLVVDMATFAEELQTDKIIGPTKLIGYSKENEKDIYFLPLIKNFDSLIFVKETNATNPIF